MVRSHPWDLRCRASLEQVTNSNRYYTWSPSSVDTTLEFTPMLWGQRQIGEWTSTINETIRTRKVTHALGPNE